MLNRVHWKFLPPSLFLKSNECNVHFCGLNSISTYTCKLWLEVLLLSVRETAAVADLWVFTSLHILAFLKCASRGTDIQLAFGRASCSLVLATWLLNFTGWQSLSFVNYIFKAVNYIFLVLCIVQPSCSESLFCFVLFFTVLRDSEVMCFLYSKEVEASRNLQSVKCFFRCVIHFFWALVELIRFWSLPYQVVSATLTPAMLCYLTWNGAQEARYMSFRCSNSLLYPSKPWFLLKAPGKGCASLFFVNWGDSCHLFTS